MKIICPEIDEYIQYCENNPHRISTEVQLLIKNIVKPILERDDLTFDRQMYDQCLSYIERWYQKPFPFQRFLYAFHFIYESDRLLFSDYFYVEGRGNGKDGMIMPLLNFFQTPLHGIKNYHIDIVANSEDQAHNSFLVTYEMLEQNKSKFKPKFYWSKELIVNKATNSRMRFNTANAKTKDGKKIGCIWFNEYHGYETYDQVKVFTSALGKVPNARIIITSTDGDVRDGALDEMLNVSLPILNGEANSIRLFPYICRINDEKEGDNPELWAKANPSIDYLPILRQQIYDDYAKMKLLPSLRVEFFTKRMNYPMRDEKQSIATWEQILKSTYIDVHKKIPRPIPNLHEKPCVVGIDYADLRDFATAGFLFEIDGEVVWISKTWICTRSPFFKDIKFPFENIGQPGFSDFVMVNEPTIDPMLVVSWVADEMQKYYVKKIIMDSYRFRMIRSIFESFGISSEDRNNPNGLVRMIRNMPSVNAMVAPVIEYLFTLGLINAGNSALWRWSCNNTGVQIDGTGNKKYYKIEPKLRKNDPTMAFMVAMSERDMLKDIVIYV